MNEELQNFIVKITTEGFSGLQTTLDKTNKMLEDMTKNFNNTQKSGDSFFGALVKWTGLVGGLTLAFQTLKSTIRGVFDTAYDVVDLYKQEQLLGVEAKVLERYGIVAQRNQGSQADAYSFFGDVNDLMGRFRSGKITQDDTYKFSKLGIAFNYKKGQSLAENRDRYLQELQKAVSRIDLNDADKMSVMRDLIKQSSMQALFMSNAEQFNKQMEWGDKLRVLSKDENDLQNAQDLITTQVEWKQTLADFKIQLMPLLRDVLNALKPLIPIIRDKITLMGDWVDKHGKDIAKYVEDGVNWLINDFPQTLSDIWNLLKAIVGALTPIVEWVVNKLGGNLQAVWDVAKVGWKNLVGSEDADEQTQKFIKEYFTAGSTKGGYYGDFLRWVAGVPKVATTSNVINNNGNSYVLKAGTHTFPKDLVLGDNWSGNPAHYATSVRG